MQIFDGLHTKVQLISKRVIYEYDAFGNVVISEEKIRNIFKFTGEQYDQLTGQYYLKARYYNPVIGRFTQMDTYLGDGLNLYAYVQNNPVRYVDPSGHCAKCSKENGVSGKTTVPNPNGYKQRRYADAVEIIDGEVTRIHQVGRVNQNGTPIIRESKAIDDIVNSPDYNGAPVYF